MKTRRAHLDSLKRQKKNALIRQMRVSVGPPTNNTKQNKKMKFNKQNKEREKNGFVANDLPKIKYQHALDILASLKQIHFHFRFERNCAVVEEDL